jgi:hypothetical protein
VLFEVGSLKGDPSAEGHRSARNAASRAFHSVSSYLVRARARGLGELCVLDDMQALRGLASATGPAACFPTSSTYASRSRG